MRVLSLMTGLLISSIAHATPVPLELGSYGDAPIEISEDGDALALSFDMKSAQPLKAQGDRRFTLPDGRIITFIGRVGTSPSALLVDGQLFRRRDIGAETLAKMQGWYRGKDFDALRVAARAMAPTVDDKADLPADLVEPATLDSSIRVRLAYATTSNFAGQRFYETNARLYLQRAPAMALARAAARLKPKGYGLLLHDGYRPWYVTRLFWDAMPEEGRIYVADPAKGSRHNRGAAIDLTLYHLKNGREVIMPGAVDEPAPKSYARAPAGTSQQREARDALREAMQAEGFTVFTEEWWHFDFDGRRRYPIMNVEPDANAPAAARERYPAK